MKKSELFFTALLVPVDFLMIFLAALAAYFLRFTPYFVGIRPILFDLPLSKYVILVSAIVPFLILIFALAGLYKIAKRRLIDDFYGIFIGVSTGVAALALFIFLRAELFESRFLIIASWLFSVLFVILGRFLVRLIRHQLYRYGVGVHRVVLIGNTSASANLMRDFEKSLSGYRVVSKINNFDDSTLKLLAKINQEPGIDEIIQADPLLSKEKMLDLIDFADESKIDIKYVPDLFGTQATNIDVKPIAGFPIVELKRTPLDGWGRIIKRTVDLFGAILGLIVLSPVFLMVALAIKLDSRGTVFVRLKRVGEDGVFNFYKFRSMVKDAHLMKKELLKYSERKGPLFKMKYDPRITRVGRILRRTRIDELPQLFNVLKNEMSLVGPRPHEPEEVARYEKRHRKVLAIKPGMTGMAQVSGGAELDFEDEVKLDTYYIENWSLRLDLQILLRTLIIVLTGQSAY
jgi:exopolysaccharide biosynthesis polyprenyl glycosylphosphotransferase